MANTQKSLFDSSPTPWEEDDADETLLATVVITDNPLKPLDYSVPNHLRDQIEVGQRVKVPLGRSNRKVNGYCVKLETRFINRAKFKDLIEVIDRKSLLSASMLETTRWMSEHYLCSWAQVLDTVVPSSVRGAAGTRLATLLSVPTQVAAKITQLNLPPKQDAILQALFQSSEPKTAAQLAKECQCTTAPIQALIRKGLVTSEKKRIYNHSLEMTTSKRTSALELNQDQADALTAILKPMNKPMHETILVHGVTGSGKTEVYIQAIEKVIQFGRQAIVLVPEISLTPQTRQRFRSRFDSVAVLHSHQSDVERHWHWQQIAAGKIQVVVGARSAVFAPTPHLGLIVLDEEHESAFKQDTALRYHARDVAIYRAKLENVPIVLGSATPSLSSWHKAKQGEYRLVEMPSRINQRPLPDVATIDLREEGRDKMSRGAISRRLHQAMLHSLNDDGQVILLLNRRGYSTHIQCHACGEVVRCPDCDIALTHHRERECAICHYCDHEIPAPNQCPNCAFEGISYGGRGTQKLEAEMRARFPNHSCLRMDTDTMRRPGSHEEALAKFRSGEVKILLGTQMIAKGLDFPNVTLVGVINADTALHLPDFRAAERTFQLVTQVAGRTGRGDRGGRVLVQTFAPEHPAIEAATRHDYRRFAQGELPIRESLGYPPYTTIMRLVIRGPVEDVTFEYSRSIAAQLREAIEQSIPSSRLLGPAPAPIAKLRGRFRFQIQVHAPDSELLREAVRSVIEKLDKPPAEVQWIVDVDPMEML